MSYNWDKNPHEMQLLVGTFLILKRITKIYLKELLRSKKSF